jgi:hypothetical protein
MTTTNYLYNSLATGGILSAIDYFAYKKPFNVKILGVSTRADYFASSLSKIIPEGTLTQSITPVMLNNISSGLLYARANYVLKYDQRSILIQFLIQANFSYVADMILSK